MITLESAKSIDQLVLDTRSGELHMSLDGTRAKFSTESREVRGYPIIIVSDGCTGPNLDLSTPECG